MRLREHADCRFAADDLVCHRSHPRNCKFVSKNGDSAMVFDNNQDIVTDIYFPMAEVFVFKQFHFEATTHIYNNQMTEAVDE